MAPKRSSLFVYLSVIIAIAVCLFLASAGRTAPAGSSDKEKVLIRSSKPYTSLVNKIQSLGGTVTQQYKHADAVAAEIPRSALPGLKSSVPAGAISKDVTIPLPRTDDRAQGKGGFVPSGEENQMLSDGVQPLGDIHTPGSVSPNAYTINNSIINVSPLHSGGTTGAGVIVAVIDSGIRPMFPHIPGTVIGGEDFVGDGLGFSNNLNNGHGTFVAGMIAAHVIFTFSPASALRNAVLAECPSCFSNPPTNTQIPMIGTAPAASIYSLRVFGPTGGAPESRIIAAMDRAIELRELYDNSLPGGQNIQVCNMSLGGATLFAAQDLEDLLANVMVEKGIVLTVAAGNAGPAGITTGSPGTSIGAITVGAASLPHNERILRRVQFGPAVGSLYRPFSGVQTSYFSSRGPNADGRLDPDVTSNGFANYGQGTGATAGTISIGSGTSFATPSVAGVAALMRQKYPTATAKQIRNAIIASANPSILSDGSGVLDQGTGYVDGVAASNLLAGGTVPNVLPPFFNSNKNVRSNINRGASVAITTGNVQQHFNNLKPGQRFEIFYDVTPNTTQVVINLANVLASLPPAQQNQLFGDDVLFTVHTAKTSSIGEGDYPHFVFTSGGTFVVDNPETGLMRITASGDWTNAGGISGDILISSSKDPLPKTTEKGKIVQGDSFVFPINIPAGVSLADFRLIWREDWSNYPLSDIDMILVRPNGTFDFTGASLNDPERVMVANPAAGQWLVIVDGFAIPAGDDKFELRVALDGNVVK